MQKKFASQGFSLVELAIVLVVIGLIIATLVQNNNLLRTASLRVVVKEIQQIESAIKLYSERHHYYPGDDKHAAKRFNNHRPINGNGNWYVSEKEALNVMHHLSISKFIDHPYQSGNEIILDSTIMPSTIIGAGYWFLSYAQPSLFQQKGDALHIGSASSTTRMDQGTLLVLEAEELDRKIDDEKPATGRFTVANGVQVKQGATACLNDNSYVYTNNNEATCLAALWVGE